MAYQPVLRLGPPDAKNAARENADRSPPSSRLWKKPLLEPNAEADRRTLVCRLTFDLIGPPPTPAEIDAFVNDRDPTAYEKISTATASASLRLAGPGIGWMRSVSAEEQWLRDESGSAHAWALSRLGHSLAE
ncbi:MAG: DUF1549 domain-containing protein [Gemmataceae bacterium]